MGGIECTVIRWVDCWRWGYAVCVMGNSDGLGDWRCLCGYGYESLGDCFVMIGNTVYVDLFGDF